MLIIIQINENCGNTNCKLHTKSENPMYVHLTSSIFNLQCCFAREEQITGILTCIRYAVNTNSRFCMNLTTHSCRLREEEEWLSRYLNCLRDVVLTGASIKQYIIYAGRGRWDAPGIGGVDMHYKGRSPATKWSAASQAQARLPEVRQQYRYRYQAKTTRKKLTISD